MSILIENWHIWYIAGVDSESRLKFLKFRPKIYFWANLGPKIRSCLFCLKIGAHSISWMLIPNPDLDFYNFNPKIHFWANLDPKIQSCSFCLKIGTHSISRILIPNSDLDFWNFDPKIHFFGKFGSKKFKVVRFVWKLVQMVSEGCWFLFQHWFSEFQILISFWANLGQKSQSCLF